MSETKEIKDDEEAIEKISGVMQRAGIDAKIIDLLIEEGLDDNELENFIEIPEEMYIDCEKYLTRANIESIRHEVLRLKEESNKAKAGGGKRRKRRSRAKRTNKKRRKTKTRRRKSKKTKRRSR